MKFNNEADAACKNTVTFTNWIDQLSELAVSSIEWDVPDTVDPVYLERSLFYHGKVVFFAVEEGLVCLSGAGCSKPNVYGVPTRRIVNGVNGFTATLDQTNSVLCYNNMIRKPSYPKALIYASRLAELDRIIELNARAQKVPVVLKAPPESQLSAENIYAEYDIGADVIRVTPDMRPDMVGALNLSVPFTGNDLRALQQDIYGQYLRERGIGSSNTGKAERLNTSEVAAGNSGLLIYQASLMTPRQQACKLVNQRFADILGGKEISCRFRRDMIDYILDDLQAGIDQKKMPSPGGYTYEIRDEQNAAQGIVDIKEKAENGGADNE